MSFSHPNSRVSPFWPTALSGDIADILAPATGSTQTGLDVYDPAMEEELNMMLEDSLSGEQQEPFGFTGASTSTDTSSSTYSDAKAALYRWAQQQELQQ